MEAVPELTPLPFKVILDQASVTSIKEFPNDPDIFDKFTDYATNNWHHKQVVVFQRVVSQFNFHKIKHEFPYFKNYYKKQKIWIKQRHLKDLLVSGIGWMSFINPKYTWYQSLNLEIESVLDLIKHNEAEERKAASVKKDPEQDASTVIVEGIPDKSNNDGEEDDDEEERRLR